MSYVLIDPDETLDYSLDWSEFLADGGSPADVLLTSAWSITPQDDLSPQRPLLDDRGIGDGGSPSAGTKTTVFVSNATYGRIYRLTNRVTTQAGRTAERSIILQCEHR